MHTYIINTTLLTLYHCRVIYYMLLAKLNFIYGIHFVDFVVENYHSYFLRMAL
jgi:hypothetical protein